MAAVTGFPPIRDYAFLSDCEVCDLVSPGGAVEWLCLPRPDSASVFGELLDRSAGRFTLSPPVGALPAGAGGLRGRGRPPARRHLHRRRRRGHARVPSAVRLRAPGRRVELFERRLGRAGPLQIMYGIGGEHELHEETLDHLSGYDGARPVRIGNGAWNQRQHDVWGMLADSVAIHARHGLRQLPRAGWELLSRLVEGTAENWREPDRGIWEVRGEPKHFTASKVLCWVALDRGARLAEQRGDEERARRWRGGADDGLEGEEGTFTICSFEAEQGAAIVSPR